MAWVTLVGPRIDAPSFRLRLASLVPSLAASGVEARAVALPRRPEWLRVWRLAGVWRGSSVIVFSKLRLLAGELGFVRRRCPRWVLDVDDAIMFGKPRRHGDPPDEARWRQRRFDRMVRHCALVITGSRFLAERIAPLGTPVETLPTPVDLRRYPVASHAGHEPLRLGWVGLGENIRYLEDLRAPLAALVASGVALELRVISDRLPDMPEVPCRLLPWSEEREGALLAECDCGLAPLPDDLWTRGKGGYRCIQYAAAGLPCVASPVGANQDIVVPGETGLWASTPREWVDSLRLLAADRTLRGRLGAGARARAAAWDLISYSARYGTLLAKASAA